MFNFPLEFITYLDSNIKKQLPTRLYRCILLYSFFYILPIVTQFNQVDQITK